jgi:hypothetical protein
MSNTTLTWEIPSKYMQKKELNILMLSDFTRFNPAFFNPIYAGPNHYKLKHLYAGNISETLEIITIALRKETIGNYGSFRTTICDNVDESISLFNLSADFVISDLNLNLIIFDSNLVKSKRNEEENKWEFEDIKRFIEPIHKSGYKNPILGIDTITSDLKFAYRCLNITPLRAGKYFKHDLDYALIKNII